jgi:hypothetical protein
MHGTWHPTLSNSEEIWQVSHQYNGHQFIVDTLKKTCSCNFWDLVGIPCRHAVAALGYKSQDPIILWIIIIQEKSMHHVMDLV